MEPDSSRWHQRLEASGASLEIHPSLLWGVALPMLRWLKERLANGGTGRPPVLALNGPVGSGKTSLTRVLTRLAAIDGVPLAVASIDDVYLTWPERRRVLQGNPFGVWRVPPGSHDIPLLLNQLDQWRRDGVLRMPRFDKTLAQGQGDRGEWRETTADAVVIEGWLMGCRSLGPTLLEKKIAAGEGLGELTAEERAWLHRWDRELEAYQVLWGACDGLWLLRPARWSLPRRWRLQAEARQRRSGGGWLPANEVDRLVRATLHSLPHLLYQDPLLSGLVDRQSSAPGGDGRDGVEQLPVLGVGVLDGLRRCQVPQPHLSSASESSEIGYSKP